MAVAGSSFYEGRQAFRVDMFQELFFVATAQDVYLLPGLLIDPHFHHGPYSSGEHWSIDDEHTELRKVYSPNISG